MLSAGTPADFKQARRKCRAPTCIATSPKLVVGSLNHQVIDDVMGFVDVMNGAIPQASHRGIVFFARNVVVGFIQ